MKTKYKNFATHEDAIKFMLAIEHEIPALELRSVPFDNLQKKIDSTLDYDVIQVGEAIELGNGILSIPYHSKAIVGRAEVISTKRIMPYSIDGDEEFYVGEFYNNLIETYPRVFSHTFIDTYRDARNLPKSMSDIDCLLGYLVQFHTITVNSLRKVACDNSDVICVPFYIHYPQDSLSNWNKTIKL